MLDIVVNYHRIQFHGKPMIQTQGNSEKPNIGPDLGPFGPNSGPQNFFIKLVVRHCPNLSSYAMSRITNEPNLREWQENLISGMFLVILPKFVPPHPRIFFVGFTCTRCWKLSQAVIVCTFKENL